MFRRNHSRTPARRRPRRVRYTPYSLYRRPLRIEPLEDRRLLAVVTVTTLSDVTDLNDGLTTLREAIFATNLVAGADTVEFAPSLTTNGPASILLTQGELKVIDSTVVVGPAANLLKIDASASDPTPTVKDGKGSRVFNIDDGKTVTQISVEISGVSLTGTDVNGSGGAILSRENLELRNSVVSGSSVLFSRGGQTGGGIFSAGGSLRVVDSDIQNNTAYLGGGIAVQGGRAELIRTTIANNIVTATTMIPKGSGLDFRGAELAVVASTISENAGTSSAGMVAVLNSQSQLAVTGSIITGNGYGIYVQNSGGTATIDMTTISNNLSRGLLLSATNQSSTKITNASIINNNGGLNLDLRSGSEAEVSDCVISGNITGGSGAGASVSVDQNSRVVFERTEFVDNYLLEPAFLVAAGPGGGLSIFNAGSVTINRCGFMNNSSGHIGGGLAIYETTPSAQTKVAASVFTGNTAWDVGGAIFCSVRGAGLSVLNCTISENSANAGGGIFASGIGIGNPTISITQSLISNNTANGDVPNRSYIGEGGGILSTVRTLTIDGSTFDNNSADGNGGGVAITAGSSSVSAINSTFSGNRAALNGGGLYSSIGASLAHSTFAQNRADQYGGGVFFAGGIGNIGNTVIAQNTAPFGRDLSGLLGITLNLHYSFIGSNSGNGLTQAPVSAPDANGNMIGGSSVIDPRLGALTNNGGPTNTHLPLNESPLINRGDPLAVAGQQDVPQFDQRGTGFPRVARGRLDIGAVEVPPIIIAGDFDSNGTVDAVDYLLWRKANGSQADLDTWRANFGASQESKNGDTPTAPDSANDEGGSTPVATSTRSSVPRRPQFASAQIGASSNVDESALLGWVAANARPRPAATSADWLLRSAKDPSAVDDASDEALNEAFAELAAD